MGIHWRLRSNCSQSVEREGPLYQQPALFTPELKQTTLQLKDKAQLLPTLQEDYNDVKPLDHKVPL